MPLVRVAVLCAMILPSVALAQKEAKPVPGCDAVVLDVQGDGIDLSGKVRDRSGHGSRWTKKGTDDAFLVVDALKPGFEVAWSFEVDHQLGWASPAIGPDGGLYFGSSDTLGLGQILARGGAEDVKDADPVFYGVHDK